MYLDYYRFIIKTPELTSVASKHVMWNMWRRNSQSGLPASSVGDMTRSTHHHGAQLSFHNSFSYSFSCVSLLCFHAAVFPLAMVLGSAATVQVSCFQSALPTHKPSTRVVLYMGVLCPCYGQIIADHRKLMPQDAGSALSVAESVSYCKFQWCHP